MDLVIMATLSSHQLWPCSSHDAIFNPCCNYCWCKGICSSFLFIFVLLSLSPLSQAFDFLFVLWCVNINYLTHVVNIYNLMPSFCRIKKITNIEVAYFFDLPIWTHFVIVHYLFVISSSCMLKKVIYQGLVE